MRDIDIRPAGWTPPRVRLVLLVLCLIIAANVFDVCATLYMVGVAGVADEHNPLMRWAMGIGPACFVAVKLGMAVSATSVLAWCACRRRTAWIGLCGLTLAALTLCAYEIWTFIQVPPAFLR